MKSPSQRAAASKSANSPEIGDNTHKDVDDNKQQAKDFLRTLLKDRLGNEGIDRALKELDSPGKGLVELDDDSDEEVEESSETAQQNEEVQAMIEDDKKTTENSNYLVESKAEVEGSTEVDGSVREPNEDVVANVSPILDDSDEGTDTELTPPPPINSESIRTVPVHEVSKVVRGAPSCNLPPHRVTAGCTAVFSLLDHQSKTIYVANAGDSRCVLCRGAVAMDLSEDHKPFNEIERNRIESAGGFVSQVGRINNNLNLSRSIGDLKYKQVKGMSAKEQIITAEPDIMCVKYTPEDEFIILACDGVWDVMTNQDICDFVRERLVKYNTMGKKSPLFYDTNGKFQQLDEVNSVKYNLSGTMAMESEDDVYPLDAIIGDVMTYCLADSVSESALGTDNMTCVVIVFDSFLERIKNKDKSLIIVSDADEEENEKIGDIDSGVD